MLFGSKTKCTKLYEIIYNQSNLFFEQKSSEREREREREQIMERERKKINSAKFVVWILLQIVTIVGLWLVMQACDW